MRGLLMAAVLASLACAAAAQGGGEPNAVARLTAAYLAAEERDAAKAVEALADERWYVRRFAAVRLRGMGLPDDAFAGVQAFARPDAKGKPPAEALEPCRAWAKTVARDPEGAAFKPAAIDAVTAIASILEEEMRFAKRDPPLARGLLAGLIEVLGECPGPEERRWLVRRVLDDLEGDRVLKELSLPALPEGDKELAEACARVGEWFAKNDHYHYYHAGEGRFLVDEGARAANTPTDEFRKQHPWGEKEGPNAPATRPGPVR